MFKALSKPRTNISGLLAFQDADLRKLGTILVEVLQIWEPTSASSSGSVFQTWTTPTIRIQNETAISSTSFWVNKSLQRHWKYRQEWPLGSLLLAVPATCMAPAHLFVSCWHDWSGGSVISALLSEKDEVLKNMTLSTNVRSADQSQALSKLGINVLCFDLNDKAAVVKAVLSNESQYSLITTYNPATNMCQSILLYIRLPQRFLTMHVLSSKPLVNAENRV